MAGQVPFCDCMRESGERKVTLTDEKEMSLKTERWDSAGGNKFISGRNFSDICV